jgi:hypothetical protein
MVFTSSVSNSGSKATQMSRCLEEEEFQFTEKKQMEGKAAGCMGARSGRVTRRRGKKVAANGSREYKKHPEGPRLSVEQPEP